MPADPPAAGSHPYGSPATDRTSAAPNSAIVKTQGCAHRSGARPRSPLRAGSEVNQAQLVVDLAGERGALPAIGPVVRPRLGCRRLIYVARTQPISSLFDRSPARN